MTESQLQAAILRELGGRPDVRLFRNQVGAGWTGASSRVGGGVLIREPRFVRYGLHPGSADLIGWQSVVITPEMVGQRVAIFTSLEVKSQTGRATEEQKNWREQVAFHGGIAGICASVDAARSLFK